MKLATLRKQAQQSTKARGHAMRWRDAFGIAGGRMSQFGECRKGSREVLLHEYCAPNEISIGGEAVALNCA